MVLCNARSELGHQTQLGIRKPFVHAFGLPVLYQVMVAVEQISCHCQIRHRRSDYCDRPGRPPGPDDSTADSLSRTVGVANKPSIA
jgi:hypothetical protein